ncbi:tyrosine-type recombinase/integrase [Bacteroides caecigallinarum]|uniref:site-specific integrase n=1 Tax=uncultured Bacteroides sp. TaxID=162156 RepID=UPI0025961C16|nr:site-specific integrase [uncultured Bacteroides sp.]MDN0052187.1 tyrosine-type recombinase/integrase [Bacteroides caecigallinarum]
MNIKRNIIFALESRKNNGVPIVENVPIRMRVIYDGKRIEFTTGHRIDVSKWDVEKQRVKNGCTNKLKISASDINSDLKHYEMEMQTVFKEFEIQNVKPTIEQIKKAYNLRIKSKIENNIENEKINFWNVFDNFIDENRKLNNWANSTFKKFGTVRNHIKEFSNNIDFECFNKVGLNEYLTFLREEKQLRNSTIIKQLKLLKWFLRWAYENGFYGNNDFSSFKPQLKETEKKVIFLNEDELKQLRSCVIPENKQYLERVRDVFIFCCYTGLRFSDVYNLKKEDVKPTYIEVTTVKTSDNLIIELNDTSKQILNKYKNVNFKGNKALPVISNQNMNDYLKELCQLAGIDESIKITYYIGNNRIDKTFPKYALIGTHTGRKTFICNALSKGIPVNVVMKWTGHKDYKSMKPYIDISNKAKAKYMRYFDS